ncbi:MAG: hypothetical protein AB7I27_08010 [Bacteriovoracaceae bacterium]
MLLIAPFLILSAWSAPETYPILSIQPYERDYVFELVNPTETKIILDCSSFIHNLEIKKAESKKIYYLTEEDCWKVYAFYQDTDVEKKCLTSYEDHFYNHHCQNIRH